MVNEKQIQDELNRMDGGLFLDKEADAYGRVFYSVKHFLQGVVEPYTALKWVYPDGSPRPLSHDLLSALRSQEGDIEEAARSAFLNNVVKREKEREAALAEADAIVHEYNFEKRGSKIITHGKLESK